MRYRAFNNTLNPAIPYIFLYDELGGQQINAVGIFHTWDITKIKTSHFKYMDDTNKITLNSNSSGLFLVQFNCSWITYDDSNDVTIISSIFKNGFELAGSRTVCSVSGAGLQEDILKNCQSICYVVYLEKGDYLQIKSWTTADTAASIANSSRLLISFIPMQGWDNSFSGRLDYKGGVLR